MRQSLKYCISLLVFFITTSVVIGLLANRFILNHGKVTISINYQSFANEELSVYWNAGQGFSDVDYQTLKTDIRKQFYEFTISLNDSLKEIRIDPDGKFNVAVLKSLTIEGLTKPILINQFNSFYSNGLEIHENADFCFLKREPFNSDPYIIIKIPLNNTHLNQNFTKRDIRVLIACFLLSIGLSYLVKTKLRNLTNRIKSSDLLLLFLFFFICFNYFTNNTLQYYISPQSTENRRLTLKPGIDSLLDHPKRYFGTYTNWFDDHYPFKQVLTQANSLIKIDVFHTSPMPDKMYIGKQDQYFSGNELLKDDITGKRRLSEVELKTLYATTLQKQILLSKQNIGYYLTIPPSKQSIYEDALPDFLLKQLRGKKMLYQFSEEIQKNKANYYIELIGPLKTRHNSNPSEKLFYQYDMHWSDWGAFLAYQILINRIASDYNWVGKALTLSEVKVDTIYDEDADLARLILMHKRYKKERYTFHAASLDSIKETVENGVFQFPIYKYKNKLAKGKVLVFRDSYSEQWKWLIASHFNESVFIWDQTITQKLIDEYKPDIVIQENCEMFLFYLFQPFKN